MAGPTAASAAATTVLADGALTMSTAGAERPGLSSKARRSGAQLAGARSLQIEAILLRIILFFAHDLVEKSVSFSGSCARAHPP
jgi:hypothetical protein